jgi:hypothetical protein
VKREEDRSRHDGQNLILVTIEIIASQPVPRKIAVTVEKPRGGIDRGVSLWKNPKPQ